MTDFNGKWTWWVGRDGEHYQDEYATRDEAVQIARDDYEGAYVIEAIKRPFPLSAFFDADDFIERTEERAQDDYGNEDGDPIFDLKQDELESLQVAVRTALDAWQKEKRLLFVGYNFTATRNREYIPAPKVTA